MTGDELDRAIEFLLQQQSKLSVDIENLKDSQAETSRKIDALTSKLDSLASTVDTLASTVDTLTSTVDQLSNIVADGFIRTETQIESGWADTREAIENLIIANESTRDLAQKVATLSLQTSQRVTNLEAKL